MADVRRGRFGDKGLYGHKRTNPAMLCVITRVRLRHFWQLPQMWWAFRRIRVETAGIEGLIRSRFLVEDPRAFVILSLWDREDALLTFGTIAERHHAAVRRCIRRANRRDGLPEIWSSQWQMYSASNNLNWGGTSEWRGVFDQPGVRQ